MVELTLPPSVQYLCKSCETLCEKECCGIAAFSFSPFNVIYHLTKTNARISDSDVASIRSGLAELLKYLQELNPSSQDVVVQELNIILPVEKMIALTGALDSVVLDACIIYSRYEARINEIDERFTQIIKVTK